MNASPLPVPVTSESSPAAAVPQPVAPDVPSAMARAPLLDVLRCFAVVAVMVEHFGIKHWLSAIGLDQVFYGAIGVRAFFVLSGFLITGILLRYRAHREAGRATLGRVLKVFYARRTLRIFPVYYLTLGVCLLFGIEAARAHIGWHLLYLTNIRRAMTGDAMFPIGHLWSLAVEEQFYLAWPCFILLCPRKWLLLAVCLVAFVGVASRYILVGFSIDPMVWDNMTTSCLDSLAIGAALAICSGSPVALRRFRLVALVLGVGVGLPSLVFHFFNYIPGARSEGVLGTFTANFLYALLIDYGASAGQQPWMRTPWVRALAYIGSISYGMYLVHQPVWSLFHRTMYVTGVTIPGLWHAPIGMVATAAVAALSWHYFERPLLRMRPDL